MKESFKILNKYEVGKEGSEPVTIIKSCISCPFKDASGCTFTDGPQFTSPPSYIHQDCPKVKA